MTTSVAMALYNGAQFLVKQLDSLRLQTKAPDQVILCDDGSRDETVSIVTEYIEKYGLQDRWTLIQNEQNLGYARNFFKALSLCNSELVFLADQDDIWSLDKLEKMACVMVENPHIELLSSKYGIMDGQDQHMHGLLAPEPKQTMELVRITPENLLRGFYWLGMSMCARKNYLDRLLPDVMDLQIAHDRILSHCAADKGSFYEFEYIGAYHRRHENNTEKEEHRISKLLDLPRKLHDIAVAKKLYADLLEAKLPLEEESRELIRKRLEHMVIRDQALQTRSLWKLLKAYSSTPGSLWRMSSVLCDVWLVFFGKQRNE